VRRAWWVVPLAMAGFGGCALPGQGGGGTDDAAGLESQIRNQLPEQVRRSTGESAYVASVSCAKASGNDYKCVATVTGTDVSGRPATQTVGIRGTCDKRACVWRTE
jgi:hypothetical protein